jgi:hypothetical protein
MHMHTTATGNCELFMTQAGLIDTILTDVGLISGEANTSRLQSQPSVKYVPAAMVLHSDPNAAPFGAPWNYCSIIVAS